MSMVLLVIVLVMFIVWLYFKYELTFFHIRLRCPKSGIVKVKSCVVTLLPPVSVEYIKIIFPIEIETSSVMVVVISLNIIE